MDFAALYEEDREGWAKVQIAALRRLATTPGPWSNLIDWDNVIEEVEDLGSEGRHAVEGLLRNAVAHALKVMAEPSSLSSQQWRKEVKNFLGQARLKYKTSMRRAIDSEKLWRQAVEAAENGLRDDLTLRSLPLSETAPFTIEELVAPSLTTDQLLDVIARFQGRAT